MVSSARGTKIHGVITSSSRVDVPEGAVVRVQVQDVSLADAPAAIVAESAEERNSLRRGEAHIATYELEAEALDPRRTYSLWVHVDMDGNGELSPGDMITTQSFPIDVRRASVRIDATVVPI